MRFRFLFSFLALAALGLATGCDSTTIVDDAGPTGPTVEFASSGASVAEGSTVTIPVTLSGDATGTVSVQVLFAAGASTAELDTDFTGFGEFVGDSTGGFQIATVTFAGTDGETQEVTFSVEDDGEIEGAEEAVFALQSADGATVGDTRLFTVVIGTLPLSDVRERPNLDLVTAEGVVTRSFGRLSYMQDESAGIAIFAFDDSPFGIAVANGDIGPGDRIQVTGKLCEFGVVGFPDAIEPGTGLKQITAPRDQCFDEGDIMEGEIEFEVLVDGEEDDVPAPQTITLAQLNAAVDGFESELVRIEDLTIDPDGDFAFQASKTYSVSDPSGPGILRTPSGPDTQIAGVPIPADPFTFEGVIGQFRLENQLTPIEPGDIITE